MTAATADLSALNPLNHLPEGAVEHRAALVFALDLIDRLDAPIVGVSSASHAGIAIHADCRHAADSLADALGLGPDLGDDDAIERDYYCRSGAVDVPGLAPRVLAKVYGPRGWDYFARTGERSTCACGRAVQ